MSDLTATNCGCNNNSCGCGCGNNGGFLGGSCIWIILLLFCCGGNGNGIFGGNCGCDNGCGNNNNCCDWIIWILLISCFCGNGCGNGCGNSWGNHCGCNNNNCGCCESLAFAKVGSLVEPIFHVV